MKDEKGIVKQIKRVKENRILGRSFWGWINLFFGVVFALIAINFFRSSILLMSIYSFLVGLYFSAWFFEKTYLDYKGMVIDLLNINQEILKERMRLYNEKKELYKGMVKRESRSRRIKR